MAPILSPHGQERMPWYESPATPNIAHGPHRPSLHPRAASAEMCHQLKTESRKPGSPSACSSEAGVPDWSEARLGW